VTAVTPTIPALWRAARPAMLPLLLLLPVLGYGWAHWEARLAWRHEARLWLVLAAWTSLHAGTMWLNAMLDQDEDAVLFGHPAPLSTAARPLAIAALAVSVTLAAAADLLASGAALGCAVLAGLYSHPATAWKGHPLAGPLVNAVGYGLLSPLAGWAVVDVPATATTLAVWPLLAVGLLAPTFAAQAFQADADAARGYRTLVVTHGPAATLRAARAALLLALCWGSGLALLSVVPRLTLWAIPAWLLLFLLLRGPAVRFDARAAQALVLGMGAAGALTCGLGVAALWLGAV